MSNRRPNHHRTGIIGQDYPIDPYRPDLHTAFDPYDRDWRTGNPAKLTDEQDAAWEQAVRDAQDARDHRDSAVAHRRGWHAARHAAAQYKTYNESYDAAYYAYCKAADYSDRTGNPGDSGGFLWEFEGEPTTLQAVLEANPPGEPSNRLVRAAIAHFMRAAQNPAFQRGAVLFGGGAGADLVFSVRRAGVPAWSYDEQEADAQYIEALIDADPSLLTARRPLR